MFGARGKRDALVTGEQQLVRVTGREGGEDGGLPKLSPSPEWREKRWMTFSAWLIVSSEGEAIARPSAYACAE